MCMRRRWSRARNSRDRRSRWPRKQGPQPDQVVRGGGEGHDPIDAFTAAVAQLPQPADGLHPAEDLLDQLPFPLTDCVAFRPGRPTVDRRVLVLLGDMWRHPEGADAFDKAGHVEGLVGADRHSVGRFAEEHEGGIAFRRPGRRRDAHIGHQAVAIVEEHVARIRHLASRPGPFRASNASASVID